MQIIVFTLEDNYYAINTEKVHEISKITDVTKVPNSSDWVNGLMNLRGNVVALVDLSIILHQKVEKCYNNIIIVEVNDEQFGLLVNDINEVLEINQNSIEKISTDNTDGILGIIQLNDKIVNLIDLNMIL